MTRGVCELCGKERLVSGFRRGARVFQAVCGPCKLDGADLDKIAADVEKRIGGGVKVEVKRG